MNKKKEEDICPFCGARNIGGISVCNKCGRILQVNDSTPVDYRPFISLIKTVIVVAAVIAAFVVIKGNLWSIRRWIIDNYGEFSAIEVIIDLIGTLVIVAKVSDSIFFGDLYKVSVIVSFILEIIIIVIECCITGINAFEGQIFSMIVVTFMYPIIPSGILWFWRRE